MASVRTELGEIDILVNNAGVAHPAPIDRVGEAQWDEAIATNLTSAFLITQGLVAGMRERRWGRLIFLSSVAAQVGGVVGPHYAASKAGLHGLMHFYAAHLAKDGITANAIAPALIETEMVTSNPNAKPGMIPVGRFGDVGEVASVVRLLAENAYSPARRSTSTAAGTRADAVPPRSLRRRRRILARRGRRGVSRRYTGRGGAVSTASGSKTGLARNDQASGAEPASAPGAGGVAASCAGDGVRRRASPGHRVGSTTAAPKRPGRTARAPGPADAVDIEQRP